jgi:hypothetical protein
MLPHGSIHGVEEMANLEPQIRPLDDDQAWYVATRWQQLDGEYRANYLRILSVVGFYLVHLIQHYRPWGWMDDGLPASRNFHLAVTVIAAVWLLMAFAIELSLRQHLFPKGMMYLTTGMDFILLTAAVCLGNGQASPLVLGYLLIIVMSGTRFSLPLVQCATCSALFAYLFLMTVGKWPALMGGRQIETIPRYAQLMTLLAIGIAGIIVGQLIRRFRVMADYYAARRVGGRPNEQ